MGLFDFFRKDRDKSTDPNCNINIRGTVKWDEEYYFSSTKERLKKKFIAFDIETTGLSPIEDRIIELGAVIFENGIPVKKFSSLVNSNKNISQEAMRVNNISNEMIETAPSEEVVYPKLIEFLGDSLKGETLICAHNARFDISFLANTLERLGYNGNLKYIDTLSIARQLLNGLENHKQNTIAEYFGIVNDERHRAVTDAETCGKIMCCLLETEKQEKHLNIERNVTPLDSYEVIVLAYIEKLITDNGMDLDYYGAIKSSNGYISICYLYSFIKYKFSKKGKYFIISRNASDNINLPKEQCNVSEGGNDYIRVYFRSLDDIEQLNDYILNEYKKAFDSTHDYIDGSSRRKRTADETVDNFYKISINDSEQIINEENTNKVLNSYLSEIKIEKTISRDEITINPVNDRVSLNEIKGLDSWEEGWDEAFEFYMKGEEKRKKRRIL